MSALEKSDVNIKRTIKWLLSVLNFMNLGKLAFIRFFSERERMPDNKILFGPPEINPEIARFLETYAYEKDKLSKEKIQEIEEEIDRNPTVKRQIDSLLKYRESDLLVKGMHGDYE